MAQSALRRRFLDAASPTLQPEFAEWGGTTVHQMEVVRRLLLGDGMSMREVAEAEGIGLSGATQLIDRLERQGLVTRPAGATCCTDGARKGSRRTFQSRHAPSIRAGVHRTE